MEKDKMNMKVTIQEAENGIVVTCCYGEMEHEDKQYVYKTIAQVAKALPGIYSVAEAESPEETEDNLEKMKSNINKGKEY